MTTPVKTIPRSDHTFWIVDRRPFFIARHDHGVEVWQSNRPYYVNDRIFTFPAGYEPTLEDIDGVLYDSGR